MTDPHTEKCAHRDRRQRPIQHHLRRMHGAPPASRFPLMPIHLFSTPGSCVRGLCSRCGGTLSMHGPSPWCIAASGAHPMMSDRAQPERRQRIPDDRNAAGYRNGRKCNLRQHPRQGKKLMLISTDPARHRLAEPGQRRGGARGDARESSELVRDWAYLWCSPWGLPCQNAWC